MNRLSDPDGLYQSITDIQGKIEALDRAVDAVQTMRDRFARICDVASAHEVRMKEHADRIGLLEADGRNITARMEALADRSEIELARMLGEFAQEKAAIRDLMAAFSRERRGIQEGHRDLDRRMAEGVSELTTRLAYFSETMKTVLDSQRLTFAQWTDDQRERISSELARLNQEFAVRTDELHHLEDRIETYKERVAAHLIHEVEAVSDRQKTHEETTAFEIHTRMADAEKVLSDKTGAEILRLSEAFGRERETLARALTLLTAEVAAGKASREALDREAIRIREEADTRIQQAADDLAAAVSARSGRVEAFIAASKAEVRNILETLTGFRDRLAASLNQEAAALAEKQTEFQQAAAQELRRLFSEEAATARRILDQERKRLEDDNKSLEEVRAAYEETLADLNRKLQGKTAFFASKLNNLIQSAQKEIHASADSAAARIQEGVDSLSALEQEVRKKLPAMRTEIQGFGEQVWSRITALTKDQAGLRSRLAEVSAAEAPRLEALEKRVAAIEAILRSAMKKKTAS